jgi:small Trp-rich protein
MLLVGLLLLALKLIAFGPFARWSWWAVLAPFGIAAVWWHFADVTGWTQRRAMQKMARRKALRREQAMDALGLDHRRERRATRARVEAARLASADPTQAEDAPARRSGIPDRPADRSGPGRR